MSKKRLYVAGAGVAVLGVSALAIGMISGTAAPDQRAVAGASAAQSSRQETASTGVETTAASIDDYSDQLAIQDEAEQSLVEAGLTESDPRVAGLTVSDWSDPSKVVIHVYKYSEYTDQMVSMIESARAGSPLPIEIRLSGLSDRAAQEVSEKVLEDGETYGLTDPVLFGYNVLDGTAIVQVTHPGTIFELLLTNGKLQTTIDGVTIDVEYISPEAAENMIVFQTASEFESTLS